jgi:hypothetical protein
MTGAPKEERPPKGPINSSCGHHTTPSTIEQSTGSRPQEWHADLGLVDDDHTPDMRSEGWVQAAL